jgi:hypothetical protein
MTHFTRRGDFTEGYKGGAEADFTEVFMNCVLHGGMNIRNERQAGPVATCLQTTNYFLTEVNKVNEDFLL